MLTVEIPGAQPLRLEHLVLDVNGTLTHAGAVIDGVEERVRSLAGTLRVHLVTADTFGTAGALAGSLGAELSVVRDGAEKVAFAEALGPSSCAAIGNGANDAGLLRTVALGIAVIGPEGAAAVTLQGASVVCGSITVALDLLLDPRMLVATLRP